METIKNGICRLCPAYCQILAHVEDGTLSKVTGDPDSPLFKGYTCPKGRALPEQHNGSHRLLSSRKRNSENAFEDIGSNAALNEIAEQLQAIIAEHGPRSVAIYAGTGQLSCGVAASVAVSFLTALGSPMHFTSSTIDQPGKAIAMAAHGLWAGGELDFATADTWLIVGANPVISKASGAPAHNPGQRLKEAQERGLKLIVIDPRKTETAKRAAIHLQAKPGEDPTILAGLLHIIIAEGLYDAEFVRDNVDGFEDLKASVAAFAPEYVAKRADVPVEQLLDAARTYASAVGKPGRGGAVTQCTGPNMSLHGSLSEYLGYSLMSVCGYWSREGDAVVKPNVLAPAFEAKAQAMPPYQGWDYPEKMRIRGLAKTASGMPTAALADEMLLEGDGQVKALICLAGNPMAAWPDQEKTYRALSQLDLLVCLDYRMSETAQLSDYVIAPRLSLETPATTLLAENNKHYGYGLGFYEPYASYAPAVVEPPPESDVIEEWEFFYGLAQRMGLGLFVASQAGWDQFNEAPITFEMLDMENKPTTDDLHRYLTQHSRVPLDEVKQFANGNIFDIQETVQPKDPDCEARLCVGNGMMLDELQEVVAEFEAEQDRAPGFPLRLICRRHNHVVNSVGREIGKLSKKPFNPAFMHPEDIAELQLTEGDVVKITSEHSSIEGIVESDTTLRRGLVSMAHAYGGLPGPDDGRVRELGSNTGRLVSTEARYDRVTGIPLMSNIPVKVSLNQ